MTTEEAKREAARLMMEKADEALRAAEGILPTSPAASINRAYYAAFYAASAVLIREGRHFVKHAGLRSAVHQHLVATGKLSPELGRAYDNLMAIRGQADYEITSWTEPQATRAIETSKNLVTGLRKLLPSL